MGEVGVTGKKGVTLSLNTLGIAFLTIAVVVVVVAIFNSNAFELAEELLAEVAKLVPIGKPKILAFNVHQSAPDSREFTVSYEIGGNLKDFKELFVRKSHKKYYDDDYPNQRVKMSRSIVQEASILNDAHGRKEIRDPNVRAGYTLYELILETNSGGEVYDVKEIKTYDENYLELYNQEAPFWCQPEVHLCRSGRAEFYDNQRCNVIECKKKQIKITLPQGGQCNPYEELDCLNAANRYIEKVSEDFTGSANPDPNECGGYDDYTASLITEINVEACNNDQQIDELSKMMVRVNMIRDVCEISEKKVDDDDWKEKIVGEQDYGLLSYAEFNEAVDSAVNKTNSCVQSYKYVNKAPDHEQASAYEGPNTIGNAEIKGAQSYFDGNGFYKMEELTKREEEVRDELFSMLPPNIGNFEIAKDRTTEEIFAQYFYINRDNIDKVTISYCRASHAMDHEFITNDDGRVIVGARRYCSGESDEPVRYGNEFVRAENEELNNAIRTEPGMYEITIKVEPKDASRHNVITKVVKGGVYNEEYIEKYSAINSYTKKDRTKWDYTTVCVEDPKKKGKNGNECDGKNDVHSFVECDKECDVIGKKREVFKTPDQNTDGIKTSIRIDTYEAWKYRNPESGCTLIEITDHYRLSDSTCTPEEVYELYEELFKAAYTYMQNELEEREADDIDLHCSTIFDKKLKGAGGGHGSQYNNYDKFFGIKDGIHGGAVCVAKDNLKKKLDALGWVDSS